MKQTQENPWTKVAEKYPVDAIVEGKVRNLTNYGAFIELEEGIDGLLHVSDMSWTRKIHRLLAKLPTIAAYAYKKSIGQPILYPRNHMQYAVYLIHMLF